jgi:hypothetical protein
MDLCYALGVVFVAALVMTWSTLTSAKAETADAPQSLDDAWWTGPLVAYSAHSLPQGHLLIEPYLYDVSANRCSGYSH